MIPLRVLLIEDSEIDASLILRHIEKAGYSTEMIRVENEPELVESLKSEWDVIIADFQLPSFDAPNALAILQETGKDIPFIVVSGAIGEETAVALMKSGARDYVMKDNLSRLPPVVERELIEVKVRQSEKQALHALLESEQHLR
ncbi:response regulator, partial [bacterium]|nr:response regulator [bacterium]